MKFIGLPKKSRSTGEGLRTALGLGLLIVVALVCIMGAESVLSGTKPTSLTDPSNPAPSTDMLASIDGEQTVPSLVDRTEEPVAPTLPPVTETTATQATEPTEPPITETEEATTYYVTAEINLRTGPGTEYESIGTFKRGDAITVVASTSNGWKKLGEGKYVISEFLSKSVPETAKTGTYYATGSINVRSGPGTEYDVVKTLSVGSAIEITAVTSNGWYRTVKDTYVNVNVCSSTPLSTPTPKPTPKPTSKPTPTPKPIPEGVADKAAAVGLSVEDFELMAGIVESERPTGSGNYEGQVWVAQVIWNRVISGKWPNSVYGVISQLNPKQFSTWKGGYTTTRAPQDSSRNAVVDAFNNAPIPRNVIFFNNNRNWDDTYEYYGEAGGNYFYTDNKI